MKVRANVIIRGRVQGVFFRAETARTARRLGLTGWVKNLPDGTVETLFEGDEAAVKEAVGWCNVGPDAARVDGVETRWSKPSGEAAEKNKGEMDDFSITD